MKHKITFEDSKIKETIKEKELKSLCNTIQNRIIVQHLGFVLPYSFGFSYSSHQKNKRRIK